MLISKSLSLPSIFCDRPIYAGITWLSELGTKYTRQVTKYQTKYALPATVQQSNEAKDEVVTRG